MSKLFFSASKLSISLHHFESMQTVKFSLFSEIKNSITAKADFFEFIIIISFSTWLLNSQCILNFAIISSYLVVYQLVSTLKVFFTSFVPYKYRLFFYLNKYKTNFFTFFIEYSSKCLSINENNFLPCFNRMNGRTCTNKISINQAIEQIYFFCTGFRFGMIS